MINEVKSPAGIRQTLRENDEHNRLLFEPYDPLTGAGSPIPREKLHIDAEHFIFIPDYLFRTPVFRQIAEAGSLAAFADRNGLSFDKCCDFLNGERIHYDFEDWAATCARIKDKTSGKIVPFVLRRPQLKLLKVLVTMLFAGEPIRVIVLKARQWAAPPLSSCSMRGFSYSTASMGTAAS